MFLIATYWKRRNSRSEVLSKKVFLKVFQK